jgi:hypothetical protein
MFLKAKILRLIGIAGRHNIPASPASTQMIERGEFPGNMIGLVVGGRGGSDQPQKLGDNRERGQQRQRIERGNSCAALEPLYRHVEHGEMVGHEKGVEASALEGLSEALEMREIKVRIRPGPGVAPSRGVNADGPHKGAETQLTRVTHTFL